MTSPRKQPGVAFWATVVVVVALVAYPLSFGPACWLVSRTRIGESALPVIYRPITTLMTLDFSPEEVERRLAGSRGSTSTGGTWEMTSLFFYPHGYASKYATLGAAENWKWRFEIRVEYLPEPTARMDQGLWKWFRDGK